jgi:RsiW-degrading membrane proteinase PrsW (M82 family)
MALLDLFIAAVVPCLVLLWLIIRRDRYEREPFRLLLVTFILGAFSIVPAVIVELGLSSIVVEPEEPLSDLVGLILHNLIAIAVVEESFKLLATLPAYRSRAFNEPIDGVVYATTAALGFATVENIFYVLEGGWLIALLRASLSVPGHAFFGATMGFYLGMQKTRRKDRLMVHALLVPTVLHTVYNVVVSVGLGLLSLLLAASFILLLYRRVKRQIALTQRISPFKPRQEGFCIYCGSALSQGWLYCVACGRSQVPSEPEDELTRRESPNLV